MQNHAFRSIFRFKRVMLLTYTTSTFLLILATLNFILIRGISEILLGSFLFRFFGILLLMLTLFYLGDIISFSRKYFGLGSEFIVVCPKFYVDGIPSRIAGFVALSLVLIIAYHIFLPREEIILVLILILAIIANLAFYLVAKKTSDRVGNIVIINNLTFREICDVATIFNPFALLLFPVRGKLPESIGRFYEKKYEFSMLCKSDEKLRTICRELTEAMDAIIRNLGYTKIKHEAVPAVAKNLIINAYRLELEFLERLLQVLESRIGIKAKIMLGSYVAGLEELSRINIPIEKA